MDQDRFEAEVVAIAAEGVKLTVANVVARTGLPPRRVEELLDAMVAAHRLDSEIDEAQGFVFYRVRGLDDDAARTRLAVLEREIQAETAARAPLVRTFAAPRALATPSGHKSVVAGVFLALFFGPLGLLYAGPAEEVAVYFLAFLGTSFIGGLPIVGMIAPFLWLTSIALQIVYVARYNASGQRAGILPRRGPRALRR